MITKTLLTNSQKIGAWGNRLLRKVEIGAVNELKYVTPNTIKM